MTHKHQDNDNRGSRAETRSQLARARARVRRTAKIQMQCIEETAEEHRRNIDIYVQTHYRNRKPCACNMCRTPKNSTSIKGKDKLTWQELKVESAEKYAEDRFNICTDQT